MIYQAINIGLIANCVNVAGKDSTKAQMAL